MCFSPERSKQNFWKTWGSNKPARQSNRDVSGGYLVWKCQSWRAVFKTNRGNSSLASRVIIIDKPFLTLGWKRRAAGCIFDSSYLLLNANFESKMVINRYLRCLFCRKKVIVEILRSSFIGSLIFLSSLGSLQPWQPWRSKGFFHWQPLPSQVSIYTPGWREAACNFFLDQLISSIVISVLPFKIEKYFKKHVAAPRMWNHLPRNIRQSSSLANFKTLLKSHFFFKSLTVRHYIWATTVGLAPYKFIDWLIDWFYIL